MILSYATTENERPINRKRDGCIELRSDDKQTFVNVRRRRQMRF
jgi:hypothetical protein